MPIIEVPGLKLRVDTNIMTNRRVPAEDIGFTTAFHAYFTTFHALKPGINEKSTENKDQKLSSSQYQAPHCLTCWDLNEKCLSKIPNRDPNYWYFSYEAKHSNFIEIVRMVDEIHDSAAAGCRFCKVLSQIAEEVPVSEAIFQISILFRECDKMEVYYGCHYLILYAPQGSPPAWKYLTVQPDIHADPASLQSLKVLRGWINTCTQDHVLCKQESTLPSRLLQIRTSSVTLVHTEPSHSGPYIALSYCWGAGNTITTTSVNINDMTAGIPIAALPEAIQDAVHLAQELTIQYLWVDTLCIIQDVANDRDRELAQMWSIYENAFLTIAGSSSRSCEISFLRRRQGAAAMLTLMCVDDNGKPAIVKARKRTEGGLHYKGYSSQDPWETRAWTLQEKLLSTRLVAYAKEEMHWECKTLKTCQCGESPSSHFDGGDPVSFSQLSTAIDAYKFWQVQVINYSSRYLTYAEDKLPAIAGVAQKVHEATGSEYVAGLWRGNIIQDMVWQRLGKPDDWEPEWSIPETYRAPSFSWASVDGKVYWPDWIFEAKWAYHSEIMDLSYELDGTTRFGRLHTFSLQIKGPLIPALVSADEDDEDSIHNYNLDFGHYAYELDGRKTHHYHFQADVSIEQFLLEGPNGLNKRSGRRSRQSAPPPARNLPVWALSLGCATHQWKSEPTQHEQQCLILGRLENNVYERLGVFSFVMPQADGMLGWPELFHDDCLRCITII